MFGTPKGQQQAVRVLLEEMRPDEGGFEEECEQRLQQRLGEKVRKARLCKATQLGSRPRLKSVPDLG
ncbi:hypothetical protein [Kitasatospora sp. NRRL B-11411]|uniref:hypothetical protein n=1 Tax=Kitasatospora sp. NRRL B-11411 TaxID=1463822 RepID=UPI0004C46211|nr:hypothetical protein [Kitasatospora sp. NRRL B-11411]